jgi:hypothetical protein
MTARPENPTGVDPPVEQSLDTTTAEVLAHALFRTLFKEEVRVPIRVSGLIDVDVVIKDNNVLLNVGRVEAALPPLSIWRITLAYRGHPVAEYGRGVRNDAKVHVPRLLFLLLMSWAQRRKRFQGRAQAAPVRSRTSAAMPASDRRAGPVGEPPA